MADASAANDAGENEKAEFSLQPDTRKSIEELLRGMADHGMWGYKSKQDASERELALQSEGMAERLFSYLYRDDPDNAKRCWQEFTGKPADAGLLTRAKNAVLDNDHRKALTDLRSKQGDTLDKVKRLTKDKEDRLRKKETASLKQSLGDFEHRKRDYRRRATEALKPTDRDMDGMTVVKMFLKGSTKISDDLHASILEGKKVRQIKKDIQHVGGRFVLTPAKGIRQSVAGPAPIVSKAPSLAMRVGTKIATAQMAPLAAVMRGKDLVQAKNQGVFASASKGPSLGAIIEPDKGQERTMGR